MSPITIDTVKWRVPAGGMGSSPASAYFTVHHASVGHGVRVRAYPSKREVEIEQSLPKWRNGHNVHGLPVHEAMEAMREVELLVQLRTSFKLSGQAHRCIRRLDLVRDFQFGDGVDSFIRSIGSDPSYGATGTSRYESPRGGGASVYRGPQAVRAVLYNKHAEVRRRGTGVSPAVARSAEGLLRYELRLSGEGLRRRRVSSTMDLVESDLAAIAGEAFSKANFDKAVMSPEDVLVRLSSVDASAAVRNGLRGWVVAEQQGIDHGLERKTVMTYRRLLRDAELVAGHAVGGAVRLDFETGDVLDRDDASGVWTPRPRRPAPREQ